MGGMRSGLEDMNPGAGGLAGGENLDAFLQMMRGMRYGGGAGNTENPAAAPQSEWKRVDSQIEPL